MGCTRNHAGVLEGLERVVLVRHKRVEGVAFVGEYEGLWYATVGYSVNIADVGGGGACAYPNPDHDAGYATRAAAIDAARARLRAALESHARLCSGTPSGREAAEAAAMLAQPSLFEV